MKTLGDYYIENNLYGKRRELDNQVTYKRNYNSSLKVRIVNSLDFDVIMIFI